MGPPELPGGNLVRRKRPLLKRSALQWGRRNYPAETWCEGSDRFSSARRFNGAAGITRRKPQDGWGYYPITEPASMGPPELPGGNVERVIRSMLRGAAGFNGAAGITRRKLAVCEAALHVVKRASMGPPELPGGNIPAPTIAATPAASIQWGRRNYPAETRSGGRSRRRSGPRFNGAAGITRRKLPVD